MNQPETPMIKTSIKTTIKPKQYKSDVKPVWCPGCGHFSVLNAITKALAHLALATGASFIARGFTGDPNGLAQILLAAIRHKGFSVVQALSPCPTFRPEHMDWKHQIRAFEHSSTDDAAVAAQRIHADDGLSTRIIYRGELPVWQTHGQNSAELDKFQNSPDQFEKEFAL